MTIIGVGLIGGSIAQALRDQDLVGRVVGVTRRRETLQTALDMKVIDEGTACAADAVKNSNLIIICTPVRSIVSTVKEIVPNLMHNAVITDVGSVKGNIVRQCETMMPESCSFVGGHPIAGRERVGVAASFPSLFQGSRTILTPTSNTPQHALALVRLVWEAAGSVVEMMDVDYHDQVLAATSHLPHLMAYNVVNTLSDLEEHLRQEVFRYAASGFRDFTRIASSDPTMWRDICLENRDGILEILKRFQGDLDHLIQRVDEGDGDALHEMFSRSKTTRDRVLAEHAVLRGDR
ncbi:MAG: prephenate dehydrogenase/arogenate dehydrogenase family protein [Magnetococcales bacterium]|nr:prephenate dehydrogenase/arogenate dehydrogenase family protein [Magnetococcales bacterium]